MSAAKEPPRFRGYPPGYRHGPRMGTWKVDSTKTSAVIDSTGENMIITYATRSSKSNDMSMSIANGIASTANASPTVAQQALAPAIEDNSTGLSGISSQASMYEYKNPVLGRGSAIMAAPTPVPTGPDREPSIDQTSAARRVFCPSDAVKNISSYWRDEYIDDDDDDDDDDEDEDVNLNMADFLVFDDESSDDGGDGAGDVSALLPPTTADGPGPVQLETPSSDALTASGNFMKHLDKHFASGHGRNEPHWQYQSHSRHVGLLVSGYPLKGGKQAAASAPMAPPKKRKMSGSFSHRPPFGVPPVKRRMIHHR